MAGKITPAALRRFVLDTLEVSGASFREVDEHLVLAEVMVEIPAMFFDPPRLERQTLNLVFDREAAGRYPGAELVTRESCRLQWFIEGLRKRGALTLQSAAGDPAAAEKELRRLRPDLPAGRIRQVNRPYLAVNYVLSRYSDELREELVSLGFDMAGGKIHEDFLSFLQGVKMTPGVPAGEIEQPGFSLEEALTRLRRFLTKKTAALDPSWQENARRCYEEELICLYRYYHEGTAGERARAPARGAQMRDAQMRSAQMREFTRRAKELYEKFRPRVVIRPVNLGLLYLPEFLYAAGKFVFRCRPLFRRVEQGLSSPAIILRNDKE